MCRDEDVGRSETTEKMKRKSYVTEIKNREEEKGIEWEINQQGFSKKQTYKEQKILNDDEYFILKDLWDTCTHWQISC